MAERARDERIETYYEESASALAEWLVDAEDEAARLRSAWRSARRRAKWARRSADSDLRFTRGMWSDALRDLNRYRLAWLSARRRAADEHNFGVEALELREHELRRLRAELDAHSVKRLTEPESRASHPDACAP
jgi:hypothetical protein